jgi:hypothetical protein
MSVGNVSLLHSIATIYGAWPNSYPMVTGALCLGGKSPICATWPAHLNLLDMIILIVLGKQYKLWSSWLCIFLQRPVTLALFCPNIFLSTLFSDTLSLCYSLNPIEIISIILPSPWIIIEKCVSCESGKCGMDITIVFCISMKSRNCCLTYRAVRCF